MGEMGRDPVNLETRNRKAEQKEAKQTRMMMISLFENFRLRFFPPVGRKVAVEIACKAASPRPDAYSVHRQKPANINVYNLPPEPAWFIFMPWSDGKDETMLRSSRLILISKITGEVLFDGPANDEG
jgi:hypothetical protein